MIYLTNIDCDAAGPFRGKVAVSMRMIHWKDAARVVQLTSRFPAFHGAPLHVGDPTAIGIDDLSKPWLRDVFEIHDDEVPMFWACSVTPQVVAVSAKLDYLVTNAPAHLFVTDVSADRMAVVA